MIKNILLLFPLFYSISLFGNNPDSISLRKKEGEFLFGISYTANQFYRIHNASRSQDTASYFDSPWLGHVFGINVKYKTKNSFLYSLNLKYLHGEYFTREIHFYDGKARLNGYDLYASSNVSNISLGIGFGYRFNFGQFFLEIMEDLDLNRTLLRNEHLENFFWIDFSYNVLSNGFFTSQRSKFFVNSATNILYGFQITPRIYFGTKVNFILNLNKAQIEINDWEKGPKNYLFYFLGGGIELGLKISK